MDEGKWPPVDPGTRVVTTKPDPTVKDWAPGAQAQRAWGVTGTVVRHSDSHGLCYQIQHEDGTRGWYEPSEFVVV